MAKRKAARPEMTWESDREQWRKRITINGRQRTIRGDTQEEVRDQIEALRRQIVAGTLLDSNTTFAEYAAEWGKIKVCGLKPKSAEMYRNVLNNHLAPFFRNMRLTDIKPLHVKRMMASKGNLSRSSQSKILFTLSQIMESALENDMIYKNPCKGIKPGGAPAAEKVPLNKWQQKELLAAVSGTRAEIFVLLCLYAGLRREEALGLIWNSVHLDGDAPYIELRHTVTFDESGRPLHTDNLKTAAARRKIPVPPILADALREAKKNAKSFLVVPSVTAGGPMSKIAFRRLWDLVTRRVNFYVHPHLLRHTYITELCAGGMDIKKVQYLAGHADVTMTLRVYAHVKSNTPSELSGDIVKIFPGPAPGPKTKANP